MNIPFFYRVTTFYLWSLSISLSGDGKLCCILFRYFLPRGVTSMVLLLLWFGIWCYPRNNITTSAVLADHQYCYRNQECECTLAMPGRIYTTCWSHSSGRCQTTSYIQMNSFTRLITWRYYFSVGLYKHLIVCQGSFSSEKKEKKKRKVSNPSDMSTWLPDAYGFLS